MNTGTLNRRVMPASRQTRPQQPTSQQSTPSKPRQQLSERRRPVGTTPPAGKLKERNLTPFRPPEATPLTRTTPTSTQSIALISRSLDVERVPSTQARPESTAAVIEVAAAQITNGLGSTSSVDKPRSAARRQKAERFTIMVSTQA